MKKLIIISSLLATIGCASYASDNDHQEYQSNWQHQSNWQNGQNQFIEQLNLDPERAAKMEVILSSYREVPKMYFSNRADEIPDFLAQKDAELESLLTPEELAQFKQAFAEWAKKKNFKFMKFSSYQPQFNQPLELDVPDYLREEIRQTMNDHLIEIGKELRNKTINV